MKKKLLHLTAAAAAFCLLACTACGTKETEETKSELPTTAAVLPVNGYTETAVVHDPSIFYDEASKTYYAFGSDFASASSVNLIDWKQETEPNVGSETLFGTRNWGSVLTQSAALAGTGSNLWAPDVHYFNGKYVMYYSLTASFGTNKSLIGRVEADSPLGPYSNETIILESVTTTETSHPNCIDPQLFYDQDGTLWMVYGSFFTGIYIKEMDENGFPVEEGWGKLIWNNSNAFGIEGPFVFYNEATNYYYLMVSEGDLKTNYNMRVARSKKPDGPYIDIEDELVAETGDGNKLAGNYQFEGAETRVGLGHNSVMEQNGTFYVICHARNAVNGSYHLEVHQLYFNEDGWPVMNPNRYCGEARGLITQEEAAGDYDVIVHSSSTYAKIVASETYAFAADGSITDKDGANAGSWSVTSDYYVTITLNGTKYKGVLAPAWRDYGNEKGIYCMTATSSAGLPLWANAAD